VGGIQLPKLGLGDRKQRLPRPVHVLSTVQELQLLQPRTYGRQDTNHTKAGQQLQRQGSKAGEGGLRCGLAMCGHVWWSDSPTSWYRLKRSMASCGEMPGAMGPLVR
jgi:hypothetical protein